MIEQGRRGVHPASGGLVPSGEASMNITQVLLFFSILAAALWLVSAICWAFSASVEIRDNIDAIVGDLHRAGVWNSSAARFACAAGICSVVVAVCEVLRA